MGLIYTTNLSAGRLAIFCYLNAHFINSTFQLSRIQYIDFKIKEKPR